MGGTLENLTIIDDATGTKTLILTFGADVMADLEGWDPNAMPRGCPGDDAYASPRARLLYEALGVTPGDERYNLGHNEDDGRWGLFGPIASGQKWAAEAPESLALCL